MSISIALVVSTYNQPRHLDRCLFALSKQTDQGFELFIADDGSGKETQTIVGRYEAFFGSRLKHVWQRDHGFRKTRILNRCVMAATADCLVFIDGDCVAHPDFVLRHREAAQRGCYQNGAIIRLGDALSEAITNERIADLTVFNASWLRRQGGWNRRYLKLSLPLKLRRRLNRISTTRLYWLGSNSACWRDDAIAVNGFDNRFSYGFEDGDFGNRLANYGVKVRTVRWTANLLHLHHARPYRDEAEIQRNAAMATPIVPGGRFRAIDGLSDLDDGERRDAGVRTPASQWPRL